MINRNRRAEQETITVILCTALLVFICAGLSSPSFGADTGFRIFRVEIDMTSEEYNSLEPVKDFYINGGKDDGFRVSMILDVYREKIVRDAAADKGKDFKISILVGQVKVIKLFKNVAITRIISLTSPDDTPVLQYRTVMIGDYAVIGGNKRGSKISRTDNIMIGSDKISHSSVSGVLFSSKVLFGLDDWKLKSEAMEALSIVNDMFNQSKHKDILIAGYTCSIGTDEYNLELSKKRAQSVSDYLTNTIGIPKDHIHIEYHGEQFPVASNDTEEGRIKNRRVDIRFLPRGDTIYP
ncbi:MAG: OmpA family protein [Nitrospirota bacterium]